MSDSDTPGVDTPIDDTIADDTAAFADLGLREEVLAELNSLGYEEPTPIQREAIPPLIEGRDLLGQAATGTGKTAAFALPILHRLTADRLDRRDPSALVLVPTRELAIQVSQAVHRYGRALGVRVLPIYGGQPIGQQLRTLERGVDVVVATPGRAIDHLNRGTLNLRAVATIVLDEADEMLDMGFAEDLETILSSAPEERQTVLFSATIPSRIASLTRQHLTDPVRIEIRASAPAAGDAPKVRQVAYVVPRSSKAAALGRLLDVENPTAALVFCRTRDEVDGLTETLNGRGYRAEALHGGLGQEQRDKVMGRLRAGTTELLVATDVAARGLDVDLLTHVVNYDVPSAPEAYVHRIGRVGRAGREGVAITLAEPREHRMLKVIERVTGQRISVEKVPTVADLRSRQMELTRAALTELLVDDDIDHYRVIVEALSDEHDLMDIAMAAVKLAHEATVTGLGDEVEIPEFAPREKPARDKPGRPDRGDRDRGDRGDRGDRPDRGKFERGPRSEGPRNRSTSSDLTRVYIAAGRSSGVRPGDLVGAIAGESRLSGRDIGAIEIADKFSLVEVPTDAVDEVIDALRGTTIKGRKVNVRRERFTR